MARVKRNGKKLGCPRISPDKESCIVDLRANGKGMLPIGKKLGVASNTAQRVLGGL